MRRRSSPALRALDPLIASSQKSVAASSQVRTKLVRDLKKTATMSGVTPMGLSPPSGLGMRETGT